jgi:8-hydroxy-5-deazaflavin:NADPH oxidoreductase
LKIAIIGTGHIGGGLGRAWAKKGHEIIFGTRNAADPDVLSLCKQTGAQASSVSEAASAADVVVLGSRIQRSRAWCGMPVRFPERSSSTARMP